MIVDSERGRLRPLDREHADREWFRELLCSAKAIDVLVFFRL